MYVFNLKFESFFVKLLQIMFKGSRAKARERGVYIPPAYTNIMISKDPRSPLQATAVAVNGKRQYYYTPEHKALSSHKKWIRLHEFSKILPEIRKDMKNNPKSIYVGIWLVDNCKFRAGSPNGATGVSTLKPNHVKNNSVSFIGKSKVQNTCSIDKKFMKNVKEYASNPPSAVQLNDYMASFGNLTLKDFRTFHSNATFLDYLCDQHPPSTQKERKAMIKNAISYAADKLMHTPSIAKKSYLFPELLKSYESGRLDKIHGYSRTGMYKTPGEQLLRLASDKLAKK